MNSIIRCALYIRVSTEEQHLNGLSLPAQKKSLTEYAEKQGYKIINCYADEGISARKAMSNRKELMRLLEDVKAGDIDLILVTKLDRWFRNIKDYNITEEILENHNCHWKTIFENYDSSTANGQMVINIMLSVNQAECDRTSERIKAVLDYKRSIGEVTSGKCACYGYKTLNNRLIKDEAVAHIVEDIFSHYFDCYSKRQTVSYITDKYGKDAPSMYKINSAFQNETYAGIHKENEHYCDPYITKEQFLRIKKNSDAKTYYYSGEPYLFSSMIRCPVCGMKLSGFTKKQKLKNGDESKYKRYRCGQKFTKMHSGPVISESVVEAYLINNLLSSAQRELVQIKNIVKKNPRRDETIKIKQEIDRLNLLFQKGRIENEYYDNQYDLLANELKKAQTIVPMSTKPYEDILKIFGDNWTELYYKMDASHKKTFWKTYISEIEVDRESRKICGFKFLF